MPEFIAVNVREERKQHRDVREARGYARPSQPAEGDPMEWLLEDGRPLVWCPPRYLVAVDVAALEATG